MKKFLHMEDNEDNTTSITMCVDGETEQTFLYPMGFDNMVGSMAPDQSALDVATTIGNNIVEIPNEVAS